MATDKEKIIEFLDARISLLEKEIKQQASIASDLYIGWANAIVVMKRLQERLFEVKNIRELIDSI